MRLPEGAVIVVQDAAAFGRVNVPIAPADLGNVETALLEGEVRTQVYQFPLSGSLDALIAALRTQLVDAGYLVILDCLARDCGGYDFRQAVETLPPPEMVVDLGRFGYIVARRPDDGHVVMLMASVALDRGYLQKTDLSPADPSLSTTREPAPIVQTETASPANGDLFAGRGSITLEGLTFETGSASLSDADYPGLEKLAEFLRATPDARVVLVGHTDAEGALEPNIALSRERAAAVLARLVDGFDVDPAQLRAQGVGYLAPRATNSTREGRVLNRRVEAVLVAP